MRSHLPTLRELHATPRARTVPRRTQRYAFLDEDPDLAPPPRKEASLECWA